MKMRAACEEAGFAIHPEPEPHPDLEDAFHASCCGESVTHESAAGGIFGPQRIWCERCKAEVVQSDEDIDEYIVRQPSKVGEEGQ